jgi:glycosyltransferase involved in cell wall biosynthesis
MKAAIYNPYLDTLGGGERYTLAIAEVLASEGYRVDLQWHESEILEKIEKRFGRKLDSNINVVSNVKNGDGYDLCFWVSDGSIPALRARKNFLHFQVPFTKVAGKTLLNKMKLFRINKIICNSKFTKKFIDKEYGVDSVVVYPPVPTEDIKPKKKEKIILYVGRFSALKQNKGQDTLIDTFKKFSKSTPDWKLILVGGGEVGADEYIETLQKVAKGFPIEILVSPDYKIVKDLYGKASYFWSAAGFGINPEKNPELVEHFGITVVEAMAGGAIPLAYDAGGHKEIIKNGNNGYLWEKTTELIKLTRGLIATKSESREIVKRMIYSAQTFSYGNFAKRIKELL